MDSKKAFTDHRAYKTNPKRLDMIKLTITVEKNGTTSTDTRILKDEHDFHESFDCQAIRDLVDETE